jgi:ankyrin repeat protein
MSLLSWPDELLQLIVQYLESERDLNCFAQTSHRHYNLVNDNLYRYHIQHGKSTALLWAAYHGREGTARILLREGANPNVEATRLSKFAGQTPLAMAVQNRDENMVRLFIASKADPNIKDCRYFMTPLAWAAAKGHLGIFEFLLAIDGVDPDAQNAVRRTPLSHAVEIGNLAIAKLLLTKNVDPNSKDSYLGRTPLLWATAPKAIEHECNPTLPLPWAPTEELEPKRSPDQDQWWWHEHQQLPAIWPGHDLESADYKGGNMHSWAVGDAYDTILEMLLANGADINLGDRHGLTPLIWAARCGSEATVALLLEKGAQPDLSDIQIRTPLSWAAQRGQEAIVVLLLEKKVDINLADKAGRTPLSWAAEGGHKAVVELLLNEGADPGPSDALGQTPLSWAAGRGHITIVRLLHKNGAALDPEAVPHRGRIPLGWAAENGHEEVVEFLLENGVCPESGNGMKGRQVPLYGAAENGHLGVVKLLLDKSVGYGYRNTPGSKSFSERGALRAAASNGHESVLKFLLEKFSGPVRENRLEFLLDAARKGHMAVIQLLLSLSDIDINGPDYQGMTPLTVGVLHQQRDVVELLITVKGVDVNRTDKYGWTALSWATKIKDEAMIKLLLENGAEQFPYQDLWLKGDPRPPLGGGMLGCCFDDPNYKPKLSHS